MTTKHNSSEIYGTLRGLSLMRPHVLILFLLAAASTSSAQFSGLGSADAVSRENRSREQSLAAAGVDLGTGAFVYERSLLSVEGQTPIDFYVAYNSLLTDATGAMGRGWSHAYEAFVDGDPQDVVAVHWDANRKNSFRFAGAGQIYEALDLANRFDRLQRLGNGSWQLDTYDGTRYQFNSDGQLTSIQNKIRQQINMSYVDGRLREVIEPVSSRKITLHYFNNALQHIQDGENRVAFFDYDNSGRLSELRDPVRLGDAYPRNAAAVILDIPDNDAQGRRLNINVDSSETVGLFQFSSFIISHPRPSDLDVLVVPPQGPTVRIRTQAAGPVWNLSGRMFDLLEGINPQGTWQLIVVDSVAGQAGTLDSAFFRLTPRTDPYALSYNSGRQITTIRGPNNEQLLQNTYNAQGMVIAQDDGRADNLPAMFSYEQRLGRLVTTYSDRSGAVQIFEHDANYNLVSATDTLGGISTFSYDGTGRRTSARDALQRTTTFSYDPNGNLTRSVDPSGAITRYEYDSSNNLTRVVDPLERQTTWEYDSNNNPTANRDHLGHRDRKIYGGNSQMTGSLLEDGAGINYQYLQGQPNVATHPVDGNAGASRAEYDGAGRLIVTRDPGGFERRTVYNARGDIVEQTDEAGNVTRTEYDRRGRRTRIINPRGGTTRFTYDNNDNILTLTDAAGNATSYAYDGEDRMISHTDPLGAVSRLEYDALGRLVQEIDPVGNTVRYEYDAVGNDTALYDAKGVAIERVTYNDRDLPIRVVDALGSETRMDYDASERLTRVVDALGRATLFEYDELDRESGATDPLDRTATRSYLQDDVTNRIENSRGSGYSLQYDPANRISRVTYPWGFTARFNYNSRDLVTDVQEPSGRRLQYQYNAIGDVSRLDKSGSGATEPSLLYSYDSNTNLTLIETQSGGTRQPNTRYTYDNLNRVTQYRDLRGDMVSYSYNAAGYVSQITYPDGGRVNYAYDPAGRLTTVTDWASRITQYTYDPNGQITRIDFPNGTRRLMTYDQAGQIVRRRDLTSQGSVIVDYRYSYDAGGLMRVESSGTPRPPYRPQPVSMTYQTSGDQLASYNGRSVSFDQDGYMTNGPLGDSDVTFQYDAVGNLIRAGASTYAYDAEDRLVQIQDSRGTTQLTYNPLAEDAQVITSRRSGATTRYVWGVGLIYEETPNGIRVPHYDHRGSAIAFTNASGAVSGTVSFGPYGELGETTGQTDSLFLYNALFGVVTTADGLQYMRFRWYSPQIKRFLTPDAQLGEISELASLNPYTYAGANPITRNDPSGQFLHIIGAAVAGAVVGVVVQAATDLITGKKPQWQDYAAAAIGGAVGGAIVGACLGVCGPAAIVAAGAVAGALDGAGSVALGAALRGEEADPNEVLIAGALGFALGGLTAGAGARGAGKAARVLDDIPPPPRGILKKTGSAARRKAGNVRFNKVARVRVISNRNLGKSATQTTTPRRFSFSTREASLLNSKGSFSRLAKKDPKAANRLSAAISFQPKTPPLRTRPNVRNAGRGAVNNGRRGVAGEFNHQKRWAVDLGKAGLNLPNAPSRVGATF